jgi:hypothetical protein
VSSHIAELSPPRGLHNSALLRSIQRPLSVSVVQAAVVWGIARLCEATRPIPAPQLGPGAAMVERCSKSLSLFTATTATAVNRESSLLRALSELEVGASGSCYALPWALNLHACSPTCTEALL